ncbi:hypothetical protein EMIHUDRAFT_113713 [Emiliania huxleyi CCMP1516]|uniref:SLC26A/SulP transporter domain-containing protein n=2 Tax=Emiliania huxleyi TaxID=2903 RepID=A0A0D3K1F5_EMIH1|nr:hypothetical protein EMIHUDRAFT_113713 [Emiliania huxleyi CCMP1516]EOD29590.1 hypothetical protein EMIHUDRAFT_113713 [Emiliania huxleyi CCMP1516]|eukprot:XP_005782019.1 hypothetical protein EMIHUDRAFT_113713 [Emiliania huxleyi CCMP1516]
MLSYLSKLLPRLEHAPGIAAAAGTAGAATFVASQLPSQLHISAIPVSIVLGAAAGNAAPSAVTAAIKPGLSYATSNILRTGIVCVGAKLSAAQILALGWTTVPAAACSVGAGVTIIPMLAARFGLAPRLGALLACGTSICGVTAISAVAPAIAATQAEVAIAVANVVAFGSVGMLVYPHVAAALFPPSDSRAIGLFLGLAVHDTAQVMGCAASYAEQYTDAAVAKSGSGATGGVTAKTFAAAVPAFVGGFLAMAAVRTLGDAQLANGGSALFAFDRTKVLLSTGLAAVGLSVNFAAFHGAGLAPFAVGAAGASVVGGVGLSVALLMASLAPAVSHSITSDGTPSVARSAAYFLQLHLDRQTFFFLLLICHQASRIREDWNHITTASRQMGHCSILAEQTSHAHKCPHGIATCDLARVKQMIQAPSRRLADEQQLPRATGR